MFRFARLVLLSLTLAFSAHTVEAKAQWKIKTEWILAHENFLAGDALRGRKSASSDEAIAAAYVAAQFQSFGLTPAPSMTGYVQTAQVYAPTPEGAALLKMGDVTLRQGVDFYLVYTNVAPISGAVAYVADADMDAPPTAPIWVVAKDSTKSLSSWSRLGAAKGVKLIIFAQTEAIKGFVTSPQFETRTPMRLAEDLSATARPDLIVLKPDLYEAAMATGAINASMDITAAKTGTLITSNAIGYIKGTDPKAGTLLISAHLDHLGMKTIGSQDIIYHGANDDASGVVAVLELARALASGPRPRRSIVFVCYGAEEAGLLGSQYFGAHPPVPLNAIVANLEIEMIGQQDPKLPEGVMMMTGFERSDFGPTLKAKGAKITQDPYPDQHFFERSDNYALALEGLVAHTVSGWAVTPTYHSVDDDIAHLNIDFMAAAITSLIEPLRFLANSPYVPAWNEGGRPKK